MDNKTCKNLLKFLDIKEFVLRLALDYNNNLHAYEKKAGTIKFSFYGTKLRLYDNIYSNRIQKSKISFDGGINFETCSAYRAVNSPNAQNLYYEKTGLDKKVHDVIIDIPNETDRCFGFDCFDIDNDGYLLPRGLTLDNSMLTLSVDSSKQLIVTTTPAAVGVTWKSSDSSIATVDSTGKVTGIKEGSCIITITSTATTGDGKSLTATCAVTVSKGKFISLNKSTTNLIIGDSETLISTTTPAGINVKWSSSDATVATVDQNGKITAIGAGTATIIIATTDGSNLSVSCVVNVTAKGTDPILEDKIVNIAHAKGDNTNNAGGDVTIIFHGSADTTLSVVKTADVKDVWVGDNFTYTIVVTNTGTKTAKAVVVNDPAPNHIDFNVSVVTTTQGTVDSSSTSKNIIVNVGDILPGGTVTIKVPATVIL
ncbi:Ig-like domain-containing protein [Clostridium saccharoperbutylacetonicum]